MKNHMTVKVAALFFCLWGITACPTLGQQNPSLKMKLLVHVTQGTENPTTAALAFLVARTAIEEGHSVSLFLAGDGVSLIKDQVLDNLNGLGTGKLREHYDAIVKGGGKFYLSGMSSKGRGVTEVDIQGKPAEFAMPSVLVRLTLESDKVLVY